jgi:hypothetical protein
LYTWFSPGTLKDAHNFFIDFEWRLQLCLAFPALFPAKRVKYPERTRMPRAIKKTSRTKGGETWGNQPKISRKVKPGIEPAIPEKEDR